jgi:hypothetical protein
MTCLSAQDVGEEPLESGRSRAGAGVACDGVAGKGFNTRGVLWLGSGQVLILSAVMTADA